MRKELWSKSEHGKCRISCSMCLFRFSSLSPDTLAITPSGGHCTWGGGGVWEGVVADPHSPSTDPHALFCFSAQDWDGSVVFLICKLRCEQENLSLFSPHKMRHIYLCTLLLEKLEKVFPRWDIGRFQFLNAGTCFPVCCTTPRSCFSLMLKNSGKPPQTHSCAFW